MFAACMVATGDADAMVTGLTRSAAVCLDDISHVIEPATGDIAFGLTLMLGMRGKTIFIADTLVHFRPDAEQLGGYRDWCGAGGAPSGSRAAGGTAVAFHVR